MTFLSPIYLVALAAAAIPVLLHLLSRRRLPLVPFSSLHFLEKLQQRRLRRLQIRQVLLLVLRTLAVAILALAFARPSLKAPAAGAAPADIVVVIDDGLSAQAETRDGRIIALEMRQVQRLAELVGQSDRLTLIRASQPHRPVVLTPGEFERWTGEMEAACTAPLMDVALKTADSLLRASDRFNRELFVVSPFYGAGWDSLARSDRRSLVRCFLVPVGPERLDNVAVEAVTVQSTIIQPGQPVDLAVRLRNFSERPVEDLLVGVYLSEERAAQFTADLAPQGTTQTIVTLTPPTGGSLPGSVQLDDPDALSTDSKRFFVLTVPDSLRVLAVVDHPEIRASLEALFRSPRAASVKVVWTSSAELGSADFGGSDVVLLADLRAVPTPVELRLAEHVRAGGHVVMFPAGNADLVALSRGLWGRLGFAGAKGLIEGNLVWGAIDPDNPLFSGVFEGKGAPRSPQFRFCIDLAPARGDQMVIPLADGRPFLVERRFGQGRALLGAAPLSDDAGDFRFAGVFAPLVYRLMAYAARTGLDDRPEWEVGQGRPLLLAKGESAPAQLVAPDGSTYDLPPRPVLGGIEYPAVPPALPGIYELRVQDAPVGRYAVNVNTASSNLSRADLDRLSTRLSGQVLRAGRALSEQVLASRFGRELWKTLLAAAVALLVTESVLGKAGRSRESTL